MLEMARWHEEIGLNMFGLRFLPATEGVAIGNKPTRPKANEGVPNSNRHLPKPTVITSPSKPKLSLTHTCTLLEPQTSMPPSPGARTIQAMPQDPGRKETTEPTRRRHL